jgi:hypothetical protein
MWSAAVDARKQHSKAEACKLVEIGVLIVTSLVELGVGMLTPKIYIRLGCIPLKERMFRRKVAGGLSSPKRLLFVKLRYISYSHRVSTHVNRRSNMREAGFKRRNAREELDVINSASTIGKDKRADKGARSYKRKC